MLKKNVLRGKREFDAVYKRGKSVPGKYVVVFYKKNNLPHNRIAYLASKKVGNSVCRSRASRLLKESFRLINKEGVLDFSGFDVIFIARKSILDAKCEQVRRSMESTLKRTAMMKKRG